MKSIVIVELENTENPIIGVLGYVYSFQTEEFERRLIKALTEYYDTEDIALMTDMYDFSFSNQYNELLIEVDGNEYKLRLIETSIN